jgi:hypothetical protein
LRRRAALWVPRARTGDPGSMTWALFTRLHFFASSTRTPALRQGTIGEERRAEAGRTLAFHCGRRCRAQYSKSRHGAMVALPVPFHGSHVVLQNPRATLANHEESSRRHDQQRHSSLGNVRELVGGPCTATRGGMGLVALRQHQETPGRLGGDSPPQRKGKASHQLRRPWVGHPPATRGFSPNHCPGHSMPTL